MESTDISRAEQEGAAYSSRYLAVYDLRVLKVNCRFVWRCSTKHTLALYNRHMSADHLDIGTGTGWHLCNASYSVEHPRVTLIDLNRPSLDATSRRLRRRGIDAETRVGTVLQPLPVERRRFGSVSSTYLMHCVPGGWGMKGRAFQHIAEVMADDGVFFGATVLDSGVPHTPLSRAEMRRLRARGMFHNQSDDLPGLLEALGRAFESVDVGIRGSVALWTAHRPRRVADEGRTEPH
jgi:ubiquinone/menaquinone biosynthesis C-methylase UbiE